MNRLGIGRIRSKVCIGAGVPPRITQEPLADKTGETVESISNIERGIFGPKFETLEKIASVLKVPIRIDP